MSKRTVMVIRSKYLHDEQDRTACIDNSITVGCHLSVKGTGSIAASKHSNVMLLYYIPVILCQTVSSMHRLPPVLAIRSRSLPPGASITKEPPAPRTYSPQRGGLNRPSVAPWTSLWKTLAPRRDDSKTGCTVHCCHEKGKCTTSRNQNTPIHHSARRLMKRLEERL